MWGYNKMQCLMSLMSTLKKLIKQFKSVVQLFTTF